MKSALLLISEKFLLEILLIKKLIRQLNLPCNPVFRDNRLILSSAVICGEKPAQIVT